MVLAGSLSVKIYNCQDCRQLLRLPTALQIAGMREMEDKRSLHIGDVWLCRLCKQSHSATLPQLGFSVKPLHAARTRARSELYGKENHYTSRTGDWKAESQVLPTSTNGHYICHCNLYPCAQLHNPIPTESKCLTRSFHS